MESDTSGRSPPAPESRNTDSSKALFYVDYRTCGTCEQIVAGGLWRECVVVPYLPSLAHEAGYSWSNPVLAIQTAK